MPERLLRPSVAPTMSVTVEIVDSSQIPGDCIATWQEWLSSYPADHELQSPFFTPDYLWFLSKCGRPTRTAIFRENDAPICFLPFQLKSANEATYAGYPYSDVCGPITPRNSQLSLREIFGHLSFRAWDLRYLPNVLLDAEWALPNVERHYRVDSLAYLAKRKLAQRIRKLEREIGAIRLECPCVTPMAAEWLVDWKTRQCFRNGWGDLFQTDLSQAIVRELTRYHGGLASGRFGVLYAGASPVALVGGLASPHVYHIWFTAYDPAFERFSPALCLLQLLFQQHKASGPRFTDFGAGDESFKARLATHYTELRSGAICFSAFWKMRKGLGAGVRFTRDAVSTTVKRLLGK